MSESEEMQRLRELNADLLEALLAFMDMWNSGDGGRSSKRAQQKRADMWTKANAAVAKANGQQVKEEQYRAR